MRQAFFITIEGGEGVGKSSFVAALGAALTARGTRHLLSYEPGGTSLGQAVRALFLNPPPGPPIQALTELLLVSAARVEHITQKIMPALAAGQWVICDRYYDSSRVYQGILGGVPEGTLESILSETTHGAVPDLTFVLHCSVPTIMARIAQRQGDRSRFDSASLEYHERLQQGFVSLAQRFPERIELLDAHQSLDTLVAEALRRIDLRRNV